MLQKYTISCEDFPVHTYGKVIMCGDSGAGKSTLTEAIKDCSQSMSEEGEGDLRPARKPIRKPVKALTAGIISHRVKGPNANMTIYDLAGHREYYSSHSSILEHISNTTPSIFLLLVNLLLTLEEITAQLYYWAAMIGNVCKKCSQQSSIIVGIHADCISDEGKLEFLRTQIEQVARDAIKQHIFVQFTALNVTSFKGEVFGSFLSLLYSTIADVRLRCPAISLTCHVMYAFLNDKVPTDQDALSLSQLLNLLSQEKPKVLLTDATKVSKHLKVLSDKGFIVFFENDTKLDDSWIVFRPEALLEKVNGVLFAPSNFNEHLPIASNTGLIPISVLKCHFPEPKHNIDMIAQFLVRFELCQRITFASTSTNAQGALNCTSCPDLFFPPLVSANRPDTVIIPDNAFIWQICSTNINQSFSPRFLHVLVSGIADQFPLPTVEPCLVPELKPYNRRCTVWSRGICWRSKEGFSTVIEMREDFQCLLCAESTFDKSDIHYSQLILSVINVIKRVCNEFCPSVSRVELITCPPEATSDHVAATVECEVLKKIILQGVTTMADSTGNTVVNIIKWTKMVPKLSKLIDVELKQDEVTAILDEHDHTEIFQTTESASDEWRAIGRKLGFTVRELDSIVREPGRNGDEDYYEAMLRRWLDWAPPNHTLPSLQSLLSALRAAGKERQANDLATKYKVRHSIHT
ncbi:hypothetical protein EMCRGX_G000655 [Ephydatia muelleri]